MVLAEFGSGQALLSIFWFFLFFLWIMLVFRIFGDIFRDRDLSGFAKVMWIILVVLLPFLGVFIYLVARGHKMVENDQLAMQAQDEAMRQYVQSVTGSAGSPTDELVRLAELRDQGAIDDAEFAALKAKVIGS